MPRPTGVTTIAVIFFALALYLSSVGMVMLVSPGAVSMAAGAPFLSGLEVAGPYMFLLVAAAGAAIAYGLRQMHNLARRLTIMAGFAGIVMLIPSVSGSVVMMQFRNLVWGGLGIIVRVVVIWYLWQTPVAEQFSKPARNP